MLDDTLQVLALAGQKQEPQQQKQD